MRLFKRIFLITFLFIQSSMAMEETSPGDCHDILDLVYTGKNGHTFLLRPLHKLGTENAARGLSALFQIKAVAEYYEDGCGKDYDRCLLLVKRVGDRFEQWKKNKLGWVAILDGDTEEIVGFIGCAIIEKGEAIEACYARHPKWEKCSIVSRGLTEYFHYFWPLLEPAVKDKIMEVKLPINPSNLNSIALATAFKFEAKGEDYISSYLRDRKDIDEEKKCRRDYVASIKPFIATIEDRKSERLSNRETN